MAALSTLRCYDCGKEFDAMDGFFDVCGDDLCPTCAATTHELCNFCELFCPTEYIDIEGLCPLCHSHLKENHDLVQVAV